MVDTVTDTTSCRTADNSVSQIDIICEGKIMIIIHKRLTFIDEQPLMHL